MLKKLAAKQVLWWKTNIYITDLFPFWRKSHFLPHSRTELERTNPSTMQRDTNPCSKKKKKDNNTHTCQKEQQFSCFKFTQSHIAFTHNTGLKRRCKKKNETTTTTKKRNFTVSKNKLVKVSHHFWSESRGATCAFGLWTDWTAKTSVCAPLVNQVFGLKPGLCGFSAACKSDKPIRLKVPYYKHFLHLPSQTQVEQPYKLKNKTKQKTL